MAITQTQQKTGGGANNDSGYTITFNSTPTAGALITLFHGGPADGALTSISGVCASWTLAVRSLSGGGVEVWYGYATSGSTVTVTYIKNSPTNAYISEWAGAKTSSPLDKTTTNSGTSSTPSSGTITPSALDVLIGGVTTGTTSAVSGPTNSFTEWTGVATTRTAAAYKVETTIETNIDVGWTRSASYTWSGLMASFLPPPASRALPVNRPQFYSTRRR